MIYPTKENDTKSWFIKDGFEDDKRVRLDENVSGNSTDGYKLDDNSKVRFSVAAVEDRDIGCTNNFADSVKRGYVNKSTDWKNIEMTGYYKLTFAKPTDNFIVMKGPTGEHHSNTVCCSGSSYNLRVLVNENPIALEFAKEMYHVNYDDKDSGNHPITGENYSVFGHGWFGVKFIHYINSDNKTVKLEVWYNGNADKQTWKKALVTTDGGNWGDGGDECDGNKDQILKFGNARMMWRWDFRSGSDIKFKWLSIREIDAFKTFDDKPSDPVNPPTNVPDIINFRSTLKIQRDMNYNFSNCVLTGADQSFWSFTFDADDELQIERFLCNVTEQGFRTRAGQHATSGSGLLGHVPKRVDFVVRKVGTPVGNLECHIYDVNGVDKFSAPTIAASTLPSVFYADENSPPNVTSFDFDLNTRILQAGDKIMLRYTGTDPSNCVSVWCREPGDFSTGTVYVSYNSSLGTYTDFPDRDCYFTAYEDV